ncbi:MAG: hypothetical protein KDI36_08105 [Pseudomonadales bacterium]|nr:hypothetical protein [Pseudomonadales bacterium]
MNSFRNKLAIATMAAFLVGCGSGDIKVNPVTQDNSTDNSVNNSNNTSAPAAETNPCAFYVNDAGQTIQGSFDGLDCDYASTFVDAGNNLTRDLTIPELDNGGVHVFRGSLFVGESYDNDAALAAAGITKGGDGPVLTIEAGATLAFTSNADFMIINRGSQIFAAGTAAKPITITSLSDVESSRAATPTLAFDAVQQWGGMVINGFGVTNKCAYTGSVAGDDLATTDCHVDAEGAAGLDESQYGGANNNDNSGRLEYVRVKHTGAQVANGDELNGISFGGVGSNTTVNNLQVYSTYDDGIEMFGGAVNINNYVAVYARDDSLDIDEGYSGTVTNALIIQAESDGNSCIEADGIGSYSSLSDAQIANVIAQGINSRPVINNMTCIFSPNSAATATHDPGAGFRFREGIFPTVNDALVISAFGTDDPASTNYCIRIDNRSQQAAQDGDLDINSSIFSCVDKTNGQSLPNGTTVEAFVTASGNQFATTVTDDNATAASNTALVLLEGTPSIYSVDYATMVVDGAAPTSTAPVSGKSYIGALSLGASDWTAGWTYGIHPGSRARDASGNDLPLWFE